MKTISFVAAGSNSGKTTLIEKLIPLLKVRGLAVGVLKHASKGFDPERPGKDSWRFREAGAGMVALVGPGVSGPWPLCLDDPSYIALATDTKFDVSIPQFDLNNEKSIAAFILERYPHEHQ